MKTTMKMKPIVNKLYTFRVRNNKGEVGMGLDELSFTKLAVFSVYNTEPKNLLPCMLIIAKQNNLDLDKQDQFEYAMDKLLSAISWN